MLFNNEFNIIIILYHLYMNMILVYYVHIVLEICDKL